MIVNKEYNIDENIDFIYPVLNDNSINKANDSIDNIVFSVPFNRIKAVVCSAEHIMIAIISLNVNLNFPLLNNIIPKIYTDITNIEQLKNVFKTSNMVFQLLLVSRA